MPTIGSRIKAAWDAFANGTNTVYKNYGEGSFRRNDLTRRVGGSDRSIAGAIFSRIAIDCSLNRVEHVRLRPEDKSYASTIDSPLNECLTLSPNLDQTSQAFIQDVVMSMFDDGCVAIVPIETSANPETSDSFKIYQLRVGKIIEWFPKHVKIKVYNEDTGKKEDIIMSKASVAIVENPLYSVINEPNSTMQRLMRKLALLDISDEKINSGKLDLIIGLPYVIRTESKRLQAENRMKQIEDQLENGKYGIAYTDGTEHITQLNRPVENNLMKTIEYLTSMLYGQLGLTEEIMKGTADEKAMLNYYSRTIEPIMNAIALEMTRKFLSKTARSQGQSIAYFRDQFKLIPMSNMADMADKLTRNEIMTSNEVRSRLGLKPSDDPMADQLKNKNIADPNMGMNMPPQEGMPMQGPQAQEGVPQQDDDTSNLTKVLGTTLREYQEEIQNE